MDTGDNGLVIKALEIKKQAFSRQREPEDTVRPQRHAWSRICSGTLLSH